MSQINRFQKSYENVTDSREQELKKHYIRMMLGDLVLESGSFESESERNSFVAHHNLGACRCPECSGKILIWIKGEGSRRGEPAINKVNCSCDYANDAFGFYAALRGISNGQAVKELMQRYYGNDRTINRAVIDKKFKKNKELAESGTKEVMDSLLEQARFGMAMDPKGKKALNSRGIHGKTLVDFGLMENVGYADNVTLKSMRTEKDYSVSGTVFKGDGGVKIRKTTSSGEYIKEKNWRFLTFGRSAFFGPVMKGNSPIYVTEGEFDALSIMEAGYPAIAIGGVENRGALKDYISKSGDDHVFIVSFDPDKAGETGTKKAIDELREEGIRCFSYQVNGPYHDANDFLRGDRDGFSARVELGHEIADLWMNGKIDQIQTDRFMEDVAAMDKLRTENKAEALATAFETLNNQINNFKETNRSEESNREDSYAIQRG